MRKQTGDSQLDSFRSRSALLPDRTKINADRFTDVSKILWNIHVVKKKEMKGTMYATLLLLLVGVSVRASEQPDCAKECVDLPGVTQEVRRTITDEGETCT